jgi:hypothetical protein
LAPDNADPNALPADDPLEPDTVDNPANGDRPLEPLPNVNFGAVALVVGLEGVGAGAARAEPNVEDVWVEDPKTLPFNPPLPNVAKGEDSLTSFPKEEAANALADLEASGLKAELSGLGTFSVVV